MRQKPVILMMLMLRTWMDRFSTILGPPVQSKDPDDWSIRMEVLKCLNKFDQIFSSLTEIEFKVVVGPLWQTFVSSLRVYEPLSVGGADDPHEGRYDFDGAEEKKKALNPL